MSRVLVGDSFDEEMRAPVAVSPDRPVVDARVESLPLVRPARIESFDAARFIALVGIVFLHTVESRQLEPLGPIGTFGVPFYLFASLYFQAQSFKKHPDRQLHEYLLGRIRRLYLPFLGWAAIYLLSRNIKHYFLMHSEPVPVPLWTLWTGETHHLWFLPFLMIVTVLGAIANRICIQNHAWRWRVIVGCAVIGTIWAVVPRPNWLNPPVSSSEHLFFLQCWKACPSAVLGLALAWWLALEGNRTPISPAVGFIGLLLTVGMVGDQIVRGYSRLDRTLSGLGWLLVALAYWRGPVVACLARLGRYTYGTYLAHVLFIETIQSIGHITFNFPPSVGFDLFTFLVSLLGALSLSVWLSRSRRLSWLIGDA